MATKLGRVVTYLEGLQTIKSNDLLGHVTNEIHHISTTSVYDRQTWQSINLL